MATHEERLPVYCPRCRQPITVAIDVEKPWFAPQSWECPVCNVKHAAQFGAEITWVAERAAPTSTIDLPSI